MPIQPDPRPPALVVGSGISALGVVRGLGRQGIPLYAISSNPGSERASRWYRPPPHGETLADLSRLAEYLRALPLERGVLVPTSDHAAMAVAALPSDLEGRFPASQAPAPVLGTFLDKERFRELLAAECVPHPRTWPVSGASDLQAIDECDLDRLFIKPRDSQEFSRRMGVKALRPGDREQLRKDLDRVWKAGLSVVIQEYVPGPPTNHVFLDGFVDREGHVRAMLARRRLRAFPVEFGNSCATISIARKEIVQAASDLERLLSAVRYRGPFDAEFKLDERCGVHRLLEVNVRAWWQIEFAALCGVDVATMCYRDALGLPVDDVERYDVGVKWMLPYRDLRACRQLRAAGEITFVRWVRAALTAHWGEFVADDPFPGFAAGAHHVRRLFGRAASRSGAAKPAPPGGRGSLRSLHR